MNVSVERLRIWLLAGAGLLVLVIAAFLGYAHYRAHRFLTNLPKKLGVDVRRESNNVTYSQSVQGRTIYTIHAARAIERADGKMTLHDVGIVLYGRKQDRADRIYGDEFEYDQKNGVVRAIGEVHIDLQAPQAADANAKKDYAAGKDLPGAAGHVAGEEERKDEHLIHVTTSGLVFLQKLGVAATEKDIEFESGGLTGHAVGADYSSDTGVVVLHSSVRVNGLQHDRPVVLTASHAVLDRPGQLMILSQAKYVEVGGKTGSGTEGQTAQGQHVVVHLRLDGSAERVEAEGDVALTNGAGGSMTAPRGEMTLNAQNQPQSAVMTGGVKYALDDPLRQAQGAAEEGRAVFDTKGHPEHVTMTGAVHFKERARASEAAGEPWSERELHARAVELALATDLAGKTLLRDAKAIGEAQLKTTSPGAKGTTTSSALAGDTLMAHFVRVGDADHLSEVHGDGHTLMRRTNAKGVVTTAAGDSLVAHFHPVQSGVGHGLVAANREQQNKGQPSKGQPKKSETLGGGADDVSDATEAGHVVMTQLPVPKPGDASPVEQRATAERAMYDGELERTTLTGNVQVSDGTSVLWADRVVTQQPTGDATADGSVKASYGQAGSADEPVHVLAARAELKHDSQIAVFHGAMGNPARLWQGASQVDAPVLQFEQKQRRLLAHGEGAGAPMAVHTVLAGSRSGVSAVKTEVVSPRVATGKMAGDAGKTDVVRVASRDLVYTDTARTAEFSGGVEVESKDGSLRAQQVVAYLKAAPSKAAPNSSGKGKEDGAKTSATPATGSGGLVGGSVERIVASGHVEMQQTGRQASAEQVVYTASDGMFVLTGTTAVLPKVVDDQRGTVTGTLLRFHSGDDNIVVSNGGDSGAGQRVRTETRVKNKR